MTDTSQINHLMVPLDELEMHVAELGEGPAVVMLHGFPELWLSWRHQIPALANAGYRTITPDQRGYGRTGVPTGAADYDIEHLAGDIVGLLDALDIEKAVLVGHDFGAYVAWWTTVLHPDRVRATAGLSIPHMPRTPVPPTQSFREAMGDDFYILWMQEPGAADVEFDADVERALAGQWGIDRHGWRDTPLPSRPTFRSAEEQRLYVEAFRATGFTGPLSWYRNLDRNWQLLAAYEGRTIDSPSLYIGGEQDPVLAFAPSSVMHGHVTDLRGETVLPGVAHSIQEEAPEQVNELLIDFLSAL